MTLKVGTAVKITDAGLLQWTSTVAPTVAGQLGMDSATGRLSAYIGGAAVEFAHTGEAGSGALTLLETITVAGAAVASVTFNGLTGDTAKQYLLISRVVAADATQVQILANASATTYGTVVWSVNSTPGSSVINTYSTPVITDSANADIINAFTIIGAETGKERVFSGFAVVDRPGGIIIKWDMASRWTNTVDEITSIKVNGSAVAGLGIGSRFSLYRFTL
jgi:hypothetical protein